MKVAVVVFPGSNCDRDAVHGVQLAGAEAELVWHVDTDLGGADAVILPVASPTATTSDPAPSRASAPSWARCASTPSAAVDARHLQRLQVLTEAGLLPGVLRRNTTLRFEHRWVRLGVERRDTAFTHAVPEGMTLRMPIAHGEGDY